MSSSPATLDAAPIATVVLRDRRVVHANRAALELLGVRADEVLGQPFLDFVAPEDRARVVDRQDRRLRGDPAPSVYQATLVRAGRRRRVQVHAAAAGGEVVVQLLDITGESARRMRLAALAQLGALVQRQLREDDVMRTVREALEALGLESAVVRPDGGGLRVEEAFLDPEQLSRMEAAHGSRVVGATLPWTPTLRQAWAHGAGFVDDWLAEARRLAPGPLPAADELAAHGLAAVRVRVDLAGQPAALVQAVGPWLRPEDLPAFRLFGAQISGALDAARTVGELSRRNAELGALNRVGEAAATSPDLEVFLDRSCREVAGAVGAAAVALYFFDRDRGEAVLLHLHGTDPGFRDAFARMRLAAFGRVADEGAVRIRQAAAYDEPTRAQLARVGLATVATVPIRFRTAVVGALLAGYAEPHQPETCPTELLQAMGAHFAAAIETHRLLDDLRGRVSELTLLNDIAVATAALDPVLLLENALRRISSTFRAEAGAAYVVEGTEFRQVASFGVSAETAERHRRMSLASGEVGRAFAERKAVHFPDLSRTMPPWAIHPAEGLLAAVAVPLLVKDRVLGAFLLGRRRPEPFAEDELSLLSAIGVQLGVAVENARLFDETRRRAEELGLLLEVGRSLVATLELDEVLDAGVKNLARIVQASDAYLFLADARGERLVCRAVASAAPGMVGRAFSLAGDEPSVAVAVYRSGAPLTVEDGASDLRVDPWCRAQSGARACLGLPLVVRDRRIGAAVLVDARGPRRFTPAEVERATAIANQLAVATEHARLYEDLRRSYADLARTQDQLVHRERLAALGELAAIVAHEVRNPLGVIFNSLGSLRRMLRPEGDAKMLLDIVGEEADRLNRIVGDLLDFARPAPPTLRPERLDRILDDALSAALAQARGRVEVTRAVPADLPLVPMDAGLVRQALLNVALNAVQAMPDGGTLAVRARVHGASVVLELEDGGRGIPEAVRQRIFEPFFTTKATGTGLGLAVVKRILDGHRGRVEVTRAPAGGTIVALHLPLAAQGPLDARGGMDRGWTA